VPEVILMQQGVGCILLARHGFILVFYNDLKSW